MDASHLGLRPPFHFGLKYIFSLPLLIFLIKQNVQSGQIALETLAKLAKVILWSGHNQ